MRSLAFLSLFAAGAYAQAGILTLFQKALDNSTDGKCHQISTFGRIVSLAQDQKIADAITNGDAKKQGLVSAVVAILNSYTDPLKADQGLVDGCQGTIATDNEVVDCIEKQSIDKLNAVISNQTALDALTKGDAGRQDQLKKIAAAFADPVNAISSNTTETDFCKSNVDTRCIEEKVLAKYVSLASDDAALSAHFNNDTEVQQFKAGAAKAQTKLDQLKGDQALSDVCGKMPNSRLFSAYQAWVVDADYVPLSPAVQP
ncbi:hypothetical protein GQ53DRAFT_668908 [Thozetella sp. PMI_491]|nr:hypothetical protein GQ53DRAFT_668908 [Thozetella sp. PMI_491]